MIGPCDLHRLLLRKDVLCSIARGAAFLPLKTNKGHCIGRSVFSQAKGTSATPVRLSGRNQFCRPGAMSATPQAAPPAAAENGTTDNEVEALRRQVHELQVLTALMCPCDANMILH